MGERSGQVTPDSTVIAPVRHPLLGVGILQVGPDVREATWVHGWCLSASWIRSEGEPSLVLGAKDGLELALLYERRAGEWVCIGMHLTTSGLPGLTTANLRAIPLGHLTSAGAKLLMSDEAAGKRLEMVDPNVPAEWIDDVLARLDEGRRMPVPDLTYAQLSRTYVQLVGAGSRRPVATLAGQAGLSESAIRDRLREARSRGLLTSEGQGRAGGVLTRKAKTLLAKADKEKP